MIGRGFDLGDRFLQVVERDPDRLVNAVVSGVEGVGKIGEFLRRNPEEAKRVAAALALQGVEKLSNAVIAASARQIRKDLNGRRPRKIT
jgi:hypothetical protein